MTRREEFDQAVQVIKKALQDGIVTMGLTSTPRDSDKIVNEIVIDQYNPPKATYYYEHTDERGYTSDLRGTQSNFTLGILEESAKTQRMLAETKRKYQDLMDKTVSKAKELDGSQAELARLQAEILRLGAK